MLTPTYPIRPLPPQTDIETVPVLRALVEANKALAELKGRAATIPNQGILIDTLALQEAKASSEIENIVTTQDELFQADLFPEGPDSVAAKEVALYRDALHLGFRQLKETDGLILNKGLIAIFQMLKKRNDGFRRGFLTLEAISGHFVEFSHPTGARSGILTIFCFWRR
ncbi:Fic/DOC family N-terminal domain-containing protein, partial [Acetobacter oeni]|uniref:Fic/DOC family N-terminal domain-containing protein n=3 Tax=Acetobacter oeni TaxID=304077 RepID=UPI0030B84D81